MSCDFARHDAAYVLGALSPAERREFEEHLVGCTECAQGVRELAGLPGLLARVDPRVLESPPDVDPLPETLLPALVGRVRRARRRRVLVTAGVAAAAMVAAVSGALAVAASLGHDRTPTARTPSGVSSAGPEGRAMVPVGRAPVRASLALASVAWGTRLDLTCTYASDPGGYAAPADATYALVVRTRDGRVEQVATWRSLPGRTMRLTAATAARRQDIASVEIRTADGRAVLNLTA